MPRRSSLLMQIGWSQLICECVRRARRYASLFWAPMPANLDVTRTLDLFEIHQIADIMEKLMTEAVSEIFAVPTTDPSAVQERMTRLRNHMMLAGPLGIRHIVVSWRAAIGLTPFRVVFRLERALGSEAGSRAPTLSAGHPVPT